MNSRRDLRPKRKRNMNNKSILENDYIHQFHLQLSLNEAPKSSKSKPLHNLDKPQQKKEMIRPRFFHFPIQNLKCSFTVPFSFVPQEK